MAVAPGSPKPAEPIKVVVNSRSANAPLKYPTNYIRTTKYTLITFVPLNLFYQFHKVSNIFFLVNMIIAIIPGVSPVFPATTIMPLVFVLSVAAIRDAYEDYQRFTSDRRANGAAVKIVNDQGILTTIESHEVQVGDVMLLERGVEIPADAFIVSTSMDDGACFVETAQLDGETNLKPKQAKLAIHKQYNTHTSIRQLSGHMNCDAPNVSMHKWLGTLNVPGIGDMSLDMDNFLLRGCVIRNTDWVMACVTYTGVNTKLFLNLTQTPPKISRLDEKLNRLIMIILALQQVLMMVICGLAVGFKDQHAAAKAFFFQETIQSTNSGLLFLLTYLTYFVLLSSMLPISLFVSLEFCKTYQAKTMDWDEQMVNGPHTMKARTSSLNEELSQVQYVFSDKTGTLTENQMRFALCHAGGVDFDELKQPKSTRRWVESNQGSKAEGQVSNFLRLLSLCNQVVINKNAKGIITYDGSSTDEVALVDMASNNGHQLVSRTSDSMTVDVVGRGVQVADVVAILPFTAERKMMSVVVKEKTGEMRIYTKGADSFLFARLSPNNDAQQLAVAQKFLDRCADTGLRTLACAEKVFSPQEYTTWRAAWDSAMLNISPDRSRLLHEAALLGESGLFFVGCTAIEDRLQDEVPETIHFLLKCGIVVWILTGDKRETAVNIAATSRLLNPRHDLVIHIDGAFKDSVMDQIESATKQAKEARGTGRKVQFIIDGKTLEAVLVEGPLYDSFRKLGLQVNAAVCCRVTPLQKASVVRMFQQLGSTCLGIGDGANDVSMIQEARVGVGIMGLEGSQAQRAADYAIPRFRHLRRLLAVHGRYSLFRNSNLIQYSFYKNIAYSMVQIFYAFYNGFSGQTVFDSWVLTFFNMSFTLFPPLVMGMFDFDIRADFLMARPKLYAELRSAFALRMSRVTSATWFTIAVAHAWLVFYISVKADLEIEPAKPNGTARGMWSSGTGIMNLLLLVIILESALAFLSWTYLHVLSIAVSLVGYVVFLFIYGSVPATLGVGAYYGVPKYSYGDLVQWLTLLLAVVVILGPQVIVVVVKRRFFATDTHVARVAYKELKGNVPWKKTDGPETSPLESQLISA